MIFRKMKEEDAASIAKLERAVFSDAWSERAVKETSLLQQAFILVAEDKGEICGYCIVYHVLDEGDIARIAVKDTSRKAGVGTGLIEYALVCAAEFGTTKLLLDVRQSNKSAITFYKKQGFVEDGIRKHFYENPLEDALLMSASKQLNDLQAF